MNHREKQRTARKLYNSDPTMFYKDKEGNKRRIKGYGIFDSTKWDERKKNIAVAVRNREIVAKANSVRRKKLLKKV